MKNGQEYLRAKMAVECSYLDTAAALVGRSADAPRRISQSDEVSKQWLARFGRLASADRKWNFGNDDLAHFYHAQALYTGDDWINTRVQVLDWLHGLQKKDGSWPSSNGISTGPHYATALWCIVLQLDHDTHPGFRRIQW